MKPPETTLIHDEVDGVKMDDALLKSHIGIMFSAGSSTTHDSLVNLVYALITQVTGRESENKRQLNGPIISVLLSFFAADFDYVWIGYIFDLRQ